jgi:hypothetical protein
MVETNADTLEFSLVAKGRQFLEEGDVPSAVQCYEKVHDPDALDETEARSMLIEAHAHLARKHLMEALDSFEEALLMGTDVQRRQALDGISNIGQIRSRLPGLTAALKKGLKEALGRRAAPVSLSLVADDENVLLVSQELVDTLPTNLAKRKKVTRVPQHLTEMKLPIDANYCIPYADKDDVDYIFEVAAWAAAGKSSDENA